MPYYDNFWQNILSTCLTFCIKLKTENQLIRFEAASVKTWLGIQQSVIDHWSGDWPMASIALMHVSTFKAKAKHPKHMPW